jgi:hypothetical protein
MTFWLQLLPSLKNVLRRAKTLKNFSQGIKKGRFKGKTARRSPKKCYQQKREVNLQFFHFYS